MRKQGRAWLVVLTGVVLFLAPTLHAASRRLGPGDDVQGAVNALQPGDTLTLARGTYEIGTVLDDMPSGTEGARITIRGELQAELRPSGGSNGLTFERQAYVTFERLVIDCQGAQNACVKINAGAHHLRFSHGEIRGGKTQGVLLTAGASDAPGFNEFHNMEIHHNGTDQQFDHGIYVNASDNVIEGGSVHHNAGCGVHNYSSSGSGNRNVVRNLRAYGHTGSCGVGILLGAGEKNVAYNNLVYGNNGGIMVGNSGRGNAAYNNTIAEQKDWCLHNDNDGTTFENNICWRSGTVLTGNVAPQTMAHTLTDDPQFMNDGSKDFRLRAGSPARRAGAALRQIFTTDFTGRERPAGAYDLGAYAAGATGETPPPTTPTTPVPTMPLPPPRHLRLLPSR